MSKATKAEAQLVLDEYRNIILKRLPESKSHHKALDKIQAEFNSTNKIEGLSLNYYRLIKHYRADINGKLGIYVVHSLFSIAIFLLDHPDIKGDCQKAIKRARILYDRHDRKLGLVLHELTQQIT